MKGFCCVFQITWPVGEISLVGRCFVVEFKRNMDIDFSHTNSMVNCVSKLILIYGNKIFKLHAGQINGSVNSIPVDN